MTLWALPPDDDNDIAMRRCRHHACHQEAANINKSLLTLGSVIKDLAEGRCATAVPRY